MTTINHDFQLGERIRVRYDASFKRGMVGYIIKIELTGRIWVLLDGCMTPAYFDAVELEHAPVVSRTGFKRRLIDFVMGR